MKILFASHGYLPMISGVSVVAHKIAHEMAERGHDVTVLTGMAQAHPNEEWDGPVRVIRIQTMRNPFWKEGPAPIISPRKMRGLIEDLAPDVIHTHDSGVLGLPLSRTRGHIDIPIVCTCHFMPRFVTRYLSPGGRTADWIEGITWRYALALYKRFDHIVFPTATQRDAFVERGLVPPTSVISNGVDTDRYRPDAASTDMTSPYGLPDAPRVLAVGRLMKDKEIDVLIRSLTHETSGRPPHLLLVGKGDDRERLEAVAAEARVSDRVHFLGFVPEEDLPALYRACDLYAIASTCEVQSIPTMQAAASGIPIVAANAGSLPELCKDGLNGFLVPSQDPRAMGHAFTRALEDPIRTASLAAASLQIATPHAEKSTFDAHEQLYLDATLTEVRC